MKPLWLAGRRNPPGPSAACSDAGVGSVSHGRKEEAVGDRGIRNVGLRRGQRVRWRRVRVSPAWPRDPCGPPPPPRLCRGGGRACAQCTPAPRRRRGRRLCPRRRRAQTALAKPSETAGRPWRGGRGTRGRAPGKRGLGRSQGSRGRPTNRSGETREWCGGSGARGRRRRPGLRGTAGTGVL